MAYIAVSPASSLPAYEPVGDWDHDFMHYGADELLVRHAREGLLTAMSVTAAGNSHEAYCDLDYLELDLAAWRSARGKKKDWVEHVLSDGFDHFTGPKRVNRINGKCSVPQPVRARPQPTFIPVRREPFDEHQFYYTLGRMVALREQGWNYMEIAKHLGQAPEFVRHHVGGPKVYWARGKDEIERMVSSDVGVIRMV